MKSIKELMHVTIYWPKVSIVIPAYNASNYLDEAIQCALSQTYRNTEILVVNDGSNDEGATRAVALKYGDRIRYFEKENGGSSSALNYGIRHMTGEWFSWLSHDDLYEPNKIQAQMDYLQDVVSKGKDPTQYVLFTANDFINQNGTVIRKWNSKKEREKAREVNQLTENHWLVVGQIKKYFFHGCSSLIHRQVFETAGLFDETNHYMNDMDMMLRIFMGHYKIRYLPECLVHGRMHSQQVSRSAAQSVFPITTKNRIAIGTGCILI